MELSSLRFLVVDDMLTIRKSVINVLTTMGVTAISGVSGGEQAWKLLVQSAESGLPIQMVICDWHLPDLTGIELAKRCRNHAIIKDVGFLMLTSEGETSNVVDAMLAGVDNYLLKPVVPEAFKEKLMAIYNKRFPK